MMSVQPRSRGTSRPARRRATQPALEALEGRLLLYSTTGGSWTYPALVTYSIVPDGTDIGGIPSNLQQALGAKAGWQQQIQKAAAIWEAVANLNLAQVPDDGSPIGCSGYQQGDPRFGDIRIGGMAQSGGQLAFAYAPPPFNGGTDAGDVFFNTAQSWQTNGTTYDLLTVAIHEFGHALGMGHSAISKAVMYASYTGAKQALYSDDTAGIQSIYSARQPDAFDADASNNSSKAATDLTSLFSTLGLVSQADLDITAGSDVDWYKITAPLTALGTMTVTMQSSGLSSLIPSVTLYNGSLRSAGTSTGRDYGDTVSVSASVLAGQTWYVKAMAGATGPAGVGAYGLQINFGLSLLGPIAPPNTVVLAQPDLNPTTTAEGAGWVVGQNVIRLLPDQSNPHADAALSRIAFGTISGYGDALEAGAEVGHDHPPASGQGVGRGDRPAGPLAVIAPLPTAGAGADLPRPGASPTMPPHHRHYRGRPSRSEAAWRHAVDAALAGWRPGRLPSAGPRLSISAPQQPFARSS